MPALPALDEALGDGVITVRPAAERDIPEILIAHQDDPLLHRRLGLRRPPSAAELGRCFEAAGGGTDSEGGEMALTICESGSDLCVGMVGVVAEADGHARATVWLAPQSRGRGLGERAWRLGSQWLQPRMTTAGRLTADIDDLGRGLPG